MRDFRDQGIDPDCDASMNTYEGDGDEAELGNERKLCDKALEESLSI